MTSTRGQATARLVLAHGFTQTGRVWGRIGRRPGRRPQLVPVDLPGHGRSSDIHADLVAGALLLGDAGGAADYLGYSMGARFCLHLALARPGLVRRLVLVSGTAGIDDAGERAERRRTDEALAERLDPAGGGPPEDTVADVRRPLGGRSDVRRRARGGQRPRRAQAQHGGRTRLESSAGRNRHPGTAVGPSWASWTCPCWW